MAFALSASVAHMEPGPEPVLELTEHVFLGVPLHQQPMVFCKVDKTDIIEPVPT